MERTETTQVTKLKLLQKPRFMRKSASKPNSSGGETTEKKKHNQTAADAEEVLPFDGIGSLWSKLRANVAKATSVDPQSNTATEERNRHKAQNDAVSKPEKAYREQLKQNSSVEHQRKREAQKARQLEEKKIEEDQMREQKERQNTEVAKRLRTVKRASVDSEESRANRYNERMARARSARLSIQNTGRILGSSKVVVQEEDEKEEECEEVAAPVFLNGKWHYYYDQEMIPRRVIRLTWRWRSE